LGAGLIWKGTTTATPSNAPNKPAHNETQEVHGLTTAAGVWLSAALGMGAGGRLYVVSVYAVVLVILVLRIGPRVAGIISDDGSGGSTTWYGTDDWETESEGGNLAAECATGTVSRGGGSSAVDRSGRDNGGVGGRKDGVVGQQELHWLLERETEDDDDITSGNVLPKVMSDGVTNTSVVHRLARINSVVSHPGFTAETHDAVTPRTALRRIRSDTEFLVPIRRASSNRRKKRYRSRNQFSGLILRD